MATLPALIWSITDLSIVIFRGMEIALLVLGGLAGAAHMVDFEFAEFSRLNPDPTSVSARGNSLGSTPTCMLFATGARVKVAR
jgi:hypothetical protein